MATISLSDLAPAEEAVGFSFAGVEFSLTGSEGYESNDPTLLGTAETHPWLKVERDVENLIGGEYVEQLSPAEDGLSAQNSVAFDPEAIRAVEEEKRAERGEIVLIAPDPKTEKVVAPATTELKPVAKPAAPKTAQETK